MNESDLKKRFLLSYIWLTGMLWLVSYGMVENGGATIRNPVWRWIVGLRDFFTWSGIVVVGAALLIWIAVELSLHLSNIQEKEEAIRRAHREQMAALKYRAQYAREEWQRRNEEEARAKVAAEKRRKSEQARIVQKQTRSPEEAAKSALSDF